MGYFKDKLIDQMEAAQATRLTKHLKIYEVTLPGFDGSTDATDDRIRWVAAPSIDVVEERYPNHPIQSLPPGTPPADADETITPPNNPPDKLPKTKTLHFLFSASHSEWFATEAAAKVRKRELVQSNEAKRNDISIQPVDIPTDKKALASWLTERGVQP